MVSFFQYTIKQPVSNVTTPSEQCLYDRTGGVQNIFGVSPRGLPMLAKSKRIHIVSRRTPGAASAHRNFLRWPPYKRNHQPPPCNKIWDSREHLNLTWCGGPVYPVGSIQDEPKGIYGSLPFSMSENAAFDHGPSPPLLCASLGINPCKLQHLYANASK